MNQGTTVQTMARLSTILLLAVFGIAACAPYQPKIEVAQDPGRQVTNFTTWNFLEPMTVETQGYSKTVVSGFRHGIEQAMTEHGYLRTSEPDLLVNVAAAISARGDASLQSDAYQAIHVQRGTFHDSWRGYGEGYGASTRQQRYGDGSISIGLIAREANTLTWEAVATGRLSGQRSDEAMAEMIETVTRQMMAELPSR
jgi:hypothetical protein